MKKWKTWESFEDVPGFKKLAGFDDAYRIRSRNYRVGVFVEDGHPLNYQLLIVIDFVIDYFIYYIGVLINEKVLIKG